MKLVVALIKPFKLEEVKEALARIGLEGMIVAEVKGFGHQKGHTEIFRGTEYSVDFHPRMRIEVAIADEQKERVVQTIVQAARTGSPGDGRVFVLPLEEVTRIDNAQQGQAAL
ncbi:MAG: P-II family nitrogen regulator [Candidatus Didemnitutus sp.]|nr:P-II family nitrogen regulator [Candidatus Didemnitutus sp.]